MRSLGATFLATVWVTAVASIVAAGAAENPALARGADNPAGMHGFDFEFGEWRVHHRVKRPSADQQWLEFDGTCTARGLMGGAVNVEDHIFNKPSGMTRGVALRAYDAKTGQWAIWWVDSRNPLGALDPPVIGRFENGVGTFYSDGTLDRKPVRTRFIWSQITPTSAHWEQAYSYDAGKTWETNWIMDFQRVKPE